MKEKLFFLSYLTISSFCTQPTHKLNVVGDANITGSLSVGGNTLTYKYVNFDEDIYGYNNMASWIKGSPTDTCNGDSSLIYTCSASFSGTCTDTFSSNALTYSYTNYYTTNTCTRIKILVYIG